MNGRTKSCGCLKREPAGGRDRSKPVNRPHVGPAQDNSQSGVRGVTLTKKGKWRADIQIKGVKKYLGVYETIEEAMQARKEAEENQ